MQLAAASEPSPFLRSTQVKIDTDRTFADLGIDQQIIDALKEQGIEHPTEIQAEALPHALKGRDVVGRSITGSGKTLAFSIPMIQELASKPGRGVKALCLAPTRELAKQVDEEFRMAAQNTDLKTAIIYGGVGYEPQFEALEVADVVIGTPGRIMDHMERGTLKLDDLEFFVLDEADRMLDMGFIDDIKKIIAQTPRYKQNFFEDPELAIVFVNTRRFADGLADYLKKQGFNARALHGGYAQNKREKVVEQFDDGDVQIICATDVAARGLDIDNITHVFNFEVPKDEKDYTHRIGRTARAGRSGKAITILMPDEHRHFARIEGDSQREIHKYGLDYKPKKVYLLPKRGKRKGRRGRRR